MGQPLPLIVLAAGAGSRFGGVKPLAPVGPQGEAILDYSVRDAVEAGFERIFLVVRSEILTAVRLHIRRGWPPTIEPMLVCQDQDRLAREAALRGRTKPLGTAHAAAVGARAAGVEGAFAVINADDLYGAHSYQLMGAHLRSDCVGDGALVAFSVVNTVQGDRPVTRALCEVGAGSRLRAIEEGSVARLRGELVWTSQDGRRQVLSGHEPVSMNFWGFSAGALASLEEAVASFVDSPGLGAGHEVLLPDVVRSMLQNEAAISVLHTQEPCWGITHGEDVSAIRERIVEPAW